MNDKKYFIRIVKGKPYADNTEIFLVPGHLLIGRSWRAHKPDISFTSTYISKKHALITYTDNGIFITDLASKAGTEVNGQPINHQKPFGLNINDLISLAQGTVTFSLHNVYPNLAEDSTSELKSPSAFIQQSPSSLQIDLDRREVLLDGQKLNTYGKDIKLLFYLYKNKNKAVSYDEIKSYVWDDRPVNSNTLIPDVGKDEIIALVYRLRKRLKTYGSHIISIPRYGYRLDL